MKCPKCGEELPLLSQVCPCCKTVVERVDAPSAVELTNSIDSIVRGAQKLSVLAKETKPAYSRALYLMILAVAAGILGSKTSSGLSWIAALVLAVIALTSFIKRKRGSKLQNYKVDFDTMVGFVDKFFKGNAEMSRFVQEASRKMTEISNEIEISKAKNGRSTLLIALAELIIVSVLIALVPTVEATTETSAVPEDYDARVEYYIDASDPESAIEVYVKSEYNNEYLGADKRKAMCEMLCDGGYTDQAESYFIDRCAGNAGDLECATVIVRYYIKKGEKEKAAAFVASIDGILRYKSDVDKLKKLL